MAEAIVGALVGAAFTIMGVYLSVRAASRQQAEVNVSAAVDDFEKETIHLRRHIEDLDHHARPAERFDADLWRSHRRNALRVAQLGKRFHPAFSRSVLTLAEGFNDQLGTITWTDETPWHFDRVLAWLDATIMLTNTWREDPCIFRRGAILKAKRRSDPLQLATQAQTQRNMPMAMYIQPSAKPFVRGTLDFDTYRRSMDPRDRGDLGSPDA